MDRPSCGYCLQKVDSVEDPRILPCDHVCCMECLEADFRKLNAVECPVCKETQHVAIKSLPSYTSHLPTKEADVDHTPMAPPTLQRCDVCSREDGGVIEGTYYCQTCEQTLCKSHLQKHNGFFVSFSKEAHKTITVAAMLESQRYQPAERCEVHQTKPVTVTCTECLQLFCDLCDLQTKCNASLAPHKIQTVSGIIRSIEDKASDLVSKITELSKVEKNAMTRFDEHEIQIDAEREKVEQNRRELYARCDQHVEVELEKYRQYKEKCYTAIDQFLVKHVTTKEDNNDKWKSIQQGFSTKGLIDKVRRHKDILEEIDQVSCSIDAHLKNELDIIFPSIPEPSLMLPESIKTSGTEYPDKSCQTSDTESLEKSCQTSLSFPPVVGKVSVFVKKPTGEVKPLDISETGTIQDLKAMVSRIEGYPLRKLMVEVRPEPVQIYVHRRYQAVGKFSLRVQLSDTVRKIKAQIWAEEVAAQYRIRVFKMDQSPVSPCHQRI